MSLVGFKKQINKANQLLNEKVGGVKGTMLEEEYIEREKRIDMCKSLFDDVLSRITEFLQPNPSYRAKMRTMNVFNKMSGKTTQKELYPQPENQLSEIFNKYGRELTNSSFGSSLSETGEAFKDMAEIKYSLEDEIKQNFVEPITKILESDIKEISYHRKKVQSRRLDFDCKKRSRDKGSKTTVAEVKLAEEKFEESKLLASEAMNNFLDCEGEHINAFAEFIKAEMDFHSRAAGILESLYKSVIEKGQECSSKPRQTKKIFTIKPRCGSDYNSSASDNSIVPEPVACVSIKRKHDINGTSITPVASCRALYEFKAENALELEFKEGDIIKLIQQLDDCWFEGEIQGRKGSFPVNYVEVLIPLSQ